MMNKLWKVASEYFNWILFDLNMYVPGTLQALKLDSFPFFHVAASLNVSNYCHAGIRYTNDE